MTTATATRGETLADLVEQLGDIPLSRIRMTPLPGSATEADLLEAEGRYHSLFELVDGVLVEKAMGYRESILACFLIRVLGAFVDPRNLGVISGEAGMVRLFPGMVRGPDVAFDIVCINGQFRPCPPVSSPNADVFSYRARILQATHDGDPTVRISDIRRITLVVKDGVVYDPAKLYEEIGVKPAV